MVKQYPYTLKVFEEQEAQFNQETAQWESNIGIWKEWSLCRDETAGGTKIMLQDGEQYQYSSIIYLPFGVPHIEKGTKIQVWNGDFLRLESNVIRFSNDQLHSRIWV